MPLMVDDDDATIKQVEGGRERATINIERERERIREIFNYILWAHWAIGALRAKEETCD